MRLKDVPTPSGSGKDLTDTILTYCRSVRKMLVVHFFGDPLTAFLSY